ncbi:hypothetical protein GCM10027592_22090 [Spirosoma flavus]
MNPFLILQKSIDAKSGDEYIINANHIIKVDSAAGQGCKILTTSGEFYCIESFSDVSAKIQKVFGT